MQLKKSLFLGISSLGLIAGAAQAQKAGDTVGYIGGQYIMTNSSITAPNTTGNPGTAPLFNQLTSGASGNISNTGMFSFGILQMVTDNIGAEITAGYPPVLNLNVTLPNAPSTLAAIGRSGGTGYNNAASANAYSPTLYAKYIFNKPEDAFRPYVGVGINYTWFTNAKTNSDFVPNTLGGGGVSLSSSINPAFTVGGIYNINSTWSLRGNVDYIPISTNATFSSAGAGLSGNSTTTKITVNPILIGLSLGYKF